MKFNLSAKKENQNQEFENGSHIARKRKAVENTFQKKNLKDVIDLLNEEDEDEALKYARYVK